MSAQDVKCVTRLLREASSLDSQGLVFVSYYMKLYTVELVLRKGVESLKGKAIELLDEIESLKQSVDEAKEQDEGSYKIVHDEDGKGKVYVLNLTVTLYNDLLKQQVEIKNTNAKDLKLESVDSLISGLWCCIDLFTVVQETWLQNEENADLKKNLMEKIQFSKVLIKQLLIQKKKLIDGIDVSEISDVIETIPDSEVEKPDFVADKNVEDVEEPDFVVDKEVTPEATPEKTNLDNDDDPVASFSLPSPPKFIEEEPKSVESATTTTTTSTTTKAQPHGKPLSEQEITAMMDWATLITKAQKHSKYGVSAMNYDDVDTAVKELEQALDILRILQTQQQQQQQQHQ